MASNSEIWVLGLRACGTKPSLLGVGVLYIRILLRRNSWLTSSIQFHPDASSRGRQIHALVPITPGGVIVSFLFRIFEKTPSWKGSSKVSQNVTALETSHYLSSNASSQAELGGPLGDLTHIHWELPFYSRAHSASFLLAAFPVFCIKNTRYECLLGVQQD